jgi:hypothetical protein
VVNVCAYIDDLWAIVKEDKHDQLNKHPILSSCTMRVAG